MTADTILIKRLEFWKHEETQIELKLKSELVDDRFFNIPGHAHYIEHIRSMICELEYLLCCCSDMSNRHDT